MVSKPDRHETGIEEKMRKRSSKENVAQNTRRRTFQTLKKKNREISPIITEGKHLREDIAPINLQNIHSACGKKESRDVAEGDNVFWLDYGDGDTEEFEAKGGKHAGEYTYMISPIGEADLFADRYLNCTGVLAIGRDAETGREISFISHQNPQFFIDGGDKKAKRFAKDLRGTLKKIMDRSEEGALDVVLIGGKYDIKDVSSKFSVQYRKSIKFLQKIVHETLGFDPKVMTGSFRGYGNASDVTVQTQTRKVWIDKYVKHPPELERPYQANRLAETEKKWRNA